MRLVWNSRTYFFEMNSLKKLQLPLSTFIHRWTFQKFEYCSKWRRFFTPGAPGWQMHGLKRINIFCWKKFNSVEEDIKIQRHSKVTYLKNIEIWLGTFVFWGCTSWCAVRRTIQQPLRIIICICAIGTISAISMWLRGAKLYLERIQKKFIRI